MLNRPAAAKASFLAGILMLLAIAACGDTPTPRPALEINPLPTPTILLPPTPTLTPIPTPTPESTPAVPPATREHYADFNLTLTDETTWSDVFNLLDAVEQDCIREAMGADIDEYLDHYVLVFDSFQDWEADTYSCIYADKGRMIFIDTLVLAWSTMGLLSPTKKSLAWKAGRWTRTWPK